MIHVEGIVNLFQTVRDPKVLNQGNINIWIQLPV